MTRSEIIEQSLWSLETDYVFQAVVSILPFLDALEIDERIVLRGIEVNQRLLLTWQSGQDARAAFRQAIEGREVTGGGTTSSGPDKPRKAAKAPLKTRASATDAERADMIRAELKALQDRLPSLNEQQAKWTQDRIAVLRKQLGD
ncbi:MAG: hypothetical protein ACXVGG_07090 [Mycobacteriaceae bacterium]